MIKCGVYFEQVLDWCHLFLHFQKFVHGFQVRWGQSFGYKFGILGKCSKYNIWERFWQAFAQSVDNFQCTGNLGRFGNILSDNLCIYLFAFQLQCFSHCISVTVLRSLLKSLGAPWSYFCLYKAHQFEAEELYTACLQSETDFAGWMKALFSCT